MARQGFFQLVQHGSTLVKSEKGVPHEPVPQRVHHGPRLHEAAETRNHHDVCSPSERHCAAQGLRELQVERLHRVLEVF